MTPNVLPTHNYLCSEPHNPFPCGGKILPMEKKNPKKIWPRQAQTHKSHIQRSFLTTGSSMLKGSIPLGIRHSITVLTSPPTMWGQAETIVQIGTAQWKGAAVAWEGPKGKRSVASKASVLIVCLTHCKRGNRNTALLPIGVAVLNPRCVPCPCIDPARHWVPRLLL